MSYRAHPTTTEAAGDPDGQLLFLSAADVYALFDLPRAIASQDAAFQALGNGDAALAPRVLLPNDHDASIAFSYTARLAPTGGAVCKFGSVVSGDAGAGSPSVSATIIALDPRTGRPVAVIEGTSVTTLRTPAASVVALRKLARPGASRLSVLGCGVQGQAHVRAIAGTMTLEAVVMWSPDRQHRESVTRTLASELDVEVRPAASPAALVADSDIVVSCTTSSVPILRAEWLRPGCTVISIGSFAVDRCEVGADMLARADRIVVDDVATSVAQAGPIVSALGDGTITREELIGLGEVQVGRACGRASEREIVYYNSVGLGVQDAAAAWSIIEAAREAQLGLRLRDGDGDDPRPDPPPRRPPENHQRDGGQK